MQQHASIFTRFVSIGAKAVTLPRCVRLKYTQLAPPQDSAQGAVFRETRIYENVNGIWSKTRISFKATSNATDPGTA